AAAEQVRVAGRDPHELADLALTEAQRARRCATDVAPRTAVRALLPLIGDSARYAVRIRDRGAQNLILGRRAADAHRARVIGWTRRSRCEHDVAEVVCVLEGGGREGTRVEVVDAGAHRGVQTVIADAGPEALRGGDVEAVGIDGDHVGRAGLNGQWRG